MFESILLMLAGVLIASAVFLIGWAGYKFYKILEGISVAIKAMKPETIGDALKSIQQLSAQGMIIMQLVTQLTEQLEKFNKNMFTPQDALPYVPGTPAAQPDKNGAAVIPYDETKMSGLEQARNDAEQKRVLNQNLPTADSPAGVQKTPA